MTHKSLLGLALAAAAAFPGAVSAGDPPPQDAVAPFKVGVVNLNECFNRDKCAFVKDVEEKLRKAGEERNGRVKGLERKASDLREQLEALPPGPSKLREKKARELALAKSELEFEKESSRAGYLQVYSEKQVEIYNEVRRVVDLVGKEQGFDLILRVESPQLEEEEEELEGSRRLRSIVQKINDRLVLYHKEGVDITPLVLARLNDEHQKRKTENK